MNQAAQNPHQLQPAGRDVGTTAHQTIHQNPSMGGVAHHQLGHIIPGYEYTDRNPTYSHAPQYGSPPNTFFEFPIHFNRPNISNENEDENDEDE
uniref:Uncharacterized protein n=2 Tax=Meloidogyne TaxID=189290 RepID=A0A914N6E8_MELIC